MKFSGLTDREVEHSRQQYGSNAIPDSQPTTFWEAFKETFGDPMIRILLIIAGLMIVMWVLGYADIYEPAGTIVAVLIVAFVSAKTSVASDTKYRELKGSTKKDQCKVYRNGVITVLDVEDVVVGDKILLQSGDKIPADGVLLSGSLRVDNSALNGEAEECKKEAADGSTAFPEDITGDTFVDEHSLFRGAVVFDGEGVLDVRKVGLKTMMGKMAEEMQEDEPDSPLKVKLGKLANQISRFGYIGAVVIAVLYLVHFIILAGGASAFFAMGFEAVFTKIVEAVSLAVVIIVCAVPEGLPLMISLVLMQNTSKMLDHNVLVRKAEGIETAGSLNILFSDKTGTITKGSLEVVEFFTADGKTIPIDELSRHSKVKGYVDLAIGKNTQAMFDSRHQVIGGNATDQALMKFIGENTFRAFQEDKDCQVTAFQGFNSKNKFSQARVESFGKTFYKGAPERLLAKAEKYLDAEGTVCPLDHAALNAKIDELAAKAMRVLAFGYSGRELKENEIQDDVVLIADTSQGYQNNPYLFFAQADTSVDAASSLTSDSMVLFYASRGFTLADPTRDTITVQPFLTTTENGYAVLDADNMTQGTYVVGAVATEEISEDTTARLTVYGADTLINTDVTNSFTNVDNVDLFIHSATVGFDDVSAISVEPVSLLTPTNTITTGGIWGLLFILVIPAALLIYGFVRWMHRRKL